MSKSFVTKSLVVVGVVGTVVCIRVLPQYWARQAASDAAKNAADIAAQDAARKVADDAIHDVARQAAAETARKISQTEIPSTAPAQSSAGHISDETVPGH